jgi:hypothetical protein
MHFAFFIVLATVAFAAASPFTRRQTSAKALAAAPPKTPVQAPVPAPAQIPVEEPASIPVDEKSVHSPKFQLRKSIVLNLLFIDSVSTLSASVVLNVMTPKIPSRSKS